MNGGDVGGSGPRLDCEWEAGKGKPAGKRTDTPSSEDDDVPYDDKTEQLMFDDEDMDVLDPADVDSDGTATGSMSDLDAAIRHSMSQFSFSIDSGFTCAFMGVSIFWRMRRSHPSLAATFAASGRFAVWGEQQSATRDHIASLSEEAESMMLGTLRSWRVMARIVSFESRDPVST
jgi:hypothetical protein